jgi:predicted metal-dependent hydrolase
VSVRAARILARYHRPGFDPNDRDTKQLIANWRQAFFGRHRQRTEVLPGNQQLGELAAA